MRVAIASAFRNSGRSVYAYMQRVSLLRTVMKCEVRVIAVEGDSTDDTRKLLQTAARKEHLPLDLRTCNHGGPVFGSVESAERFRCLSLVTNAIFDAASIEDDVFVFVDSDLIWGPQTMDSLIRHAHHTTGGFEIHSPMVMAGELFYDIWGFRGLDGRRFSPFPPHYPGLGEDPFEIGSAGGCLAMRSLYAQNARVRNDYALVGWCEDARSRGLKIAVHPTLRIRQA